MAGFKPLRYINTYMKKNKTYPFLSRIVTQQVGKINLKLRKFRRNCTLCYGDGLEAAADDEVVVAHRSASWRTLLPELETEAASAQKRVAVAAALETSKKQSSHIDIRQIRGPFGRATCNIIPPKTPRN